MSYVILARKYRPQVLDELAGQEHIVQTLKNSISSGRIAQSFLFVGSRGVGKTSTARILAKILNCKRRKEDEIVPCNKCDSCKEIIDGTSMDVLEIDGASNRGIDEIRNLRENVKFSPSSGKYKIYIIDEVHMLTQEAFNALLKTLEEPPAHVKFIFATTEAHRVLPTIVSRCQRFDFKRISIAAIVDTLKMVAKEENLVVEEEALYIIAKSAEGGLRDAESTLDQLASFCEEGVTLEATEQVLGLTKESTYFDLADAVQKKSSHEGLCILQQIINEGKDIRQFSKGFLEFFRDILMAKSVKDFSKVVDRTEDSLLELKNRAKLFTIDDLIYIVTVLQKLVSQIKFAAAPQISIELAIIKLTNRQDLVSLSAILEKLELLEKTGKNNTVVGNRAIQASSLSQGHVQTKTTFVADKKKTLKKPDLQQQPVQAVNLEKQEFSFNIVESLWSEVIDAVKKKRMSLGVFLSEGDPVDVDGNTITVGFSDDFSFHKETVDNLENKTIIESVLRDVFNQEVRVTFVVTKNDAEEHSVETTENEHHVKIVEAALDIFQGKTVQKKY